MDGNDPFPRHIYKIVTKNELPAALSADGQTFVGSSLDLQDGFLHLSTAKVITEVASRYFQVDADTPVHRSIHGMGVDLPSFRGRQTAS